MELCEEIFDEPLNKDNEDDFVGELEYQLNREF